ncbi:hypothetical protein [Pengzhenrongella sp.]|jgi:hypothetical protein|uniref:hypothetical protein n=1 Tax=Pengzhenrongella sp. TaxID=2888820 RepID=UPI002F9328DD
MMLDGKPTTVSLLLTSREKKALNRDCFNTHLWWPSLERPDMPDERVVGGWRFGSRFRRCHVPGILS